MVTLAAPSPPSAFRARHRPLRTRGPAIDAVSIADPGALGVHDQLAADGLVAELESQARRALRSGRDPGAELRDGERYPSLPQWLALRGSTLALHAMQRPSRSARLADGLHFEDLLAPRLDGISAVDALREQLGDERAAVIAERHRAFCEAPMSEEARLLSAARSTRGPSGARDLIAAHTVATRAERWDRVRIACVGATGDGAAALAAAAPGTPAELTLIGRDPMALVGAEVVAQARSQGTRVRAELARAGVARGARRARAGRRGRRRRPHDGARGAARRRGGHAPARRAARRCARRRHRRGEHARRAPAADLSRARRAAGPRSSSARPPQLARARGGGRLRGARRSRSRSPRRRPSYAIATIDTLA